MLTDEQIQVIWLALQNASDYEEVKAIFREIKVKE